MSYTVEQLLPAAPGMYVQTDDTTYELVVMWALVSSDDLVSEIVVGMTADDISNNTFQPPKRVYTTDVPKHAPGVMVIR